MKQIQLKVTGRVWVLNLAESQVQSSRDFKVQVVSMMQTSGGVSLLILQLARYD